jgi:3',5'-cyclic AMP phosphodiesterase CpdA
LIDLGDTTRVGDISEYAETKSSLENLKVPYHMVIGSHDIVGDGYELWQKYYGNPYYSWDYSDAHFIVLDDVSDINAFSEEQLSWLEKDLSNSSQKLKFVFLHKPPKCPLVSADQLGFTGPKSEERIDKFLNILNKYKINKIYAGHIHNYLNYTVSDIPITVVGASGGPIYNIPIIGKDFYHYIEVEVSGSNFAQKIVEL